MNCLKTAVYILAFLILFLEATNILSFEKQFSKALQTLAYYRRNGLTKSQKYQTEKRLLRKLVKRAFGRFNLQVFLQDSIVQIITSLDVDSPDTTTPFDPNIHRNVLAALIKVRDEVRVAVEAFGIPKNTSQIIGFIQGHNSIHMGIMQVTKTRNSTILASGKVDNKMANLAGNIAGQIAVAALTVYRLNSTVTVKMDTVNGIKNHVEKYLLEQAIKALVNIRDTSHTDTGIKLEQVTNSLFIQVENLLLALTRNIFHTNIKKSKYKKTIKIEHLLDILTSPYVIAGIRKTSFEGSSGITTKNATDKLVQILSIIVQNNRETVFTDNAKVTNLGAILNGAINATMVICARGATLKDAAAVTGIYMQAQIINIRIPTMTMFGSTNLVKTSHLDPILVTMAAIEMSQVRDNSHKDIVATKMQEFGNIFSSIFKHFRDTIQTSASGVSEKSADETLRNVHIAIIRSLRDGTFKDANISDSGRMLERTIDILIVMDAREKIAKNVSIDDTQTQILNIQIPILTIFDSTNMVKTSHLGPILNTMSTADLSEARETCHKAIFGTKMHDFSNIFSSILKDFRDTIQTSASGVSDKSATETLRNVNIAIIKSLRDGTIKGATISDDGSTLNNNISVDIIKDDRNKVTNATKHDAYMDGQIITIRVESNLLFDYFRQDKVSTNVGEILRNFGLVEITKAREDSKNGADVKNDLSLVQSEISSQIIRSIREAIHSENGKVSSELMDGLVSKKTDHSLLDVRNRIVERLELLNPKGAESLVTNIHNLQPRPLHEVLMETRRGLLEDLQAIDPSTIANRTIQYHAFGESERYKDIIEARRHFHNEFEKICDISKATKLQSEINRRLPKPYDAMLEARKGLIGFMTFINTDEYGEDIIEEYEYERLIGDLDEMNSIRETMKKKSLTEFQTEYQPEVIEKIKQKIPAH